MRRTTRVSTTVAATLLAAAFVAPASASADGGSQDDWTSQSQGDRLKAVGLTGGGTALVKFETTRPGSAYRIGTVAGLAGDTRLVGIDYRVQNGKLYGVGNNGGIYTIKSWNAQATKVGQLSVALQGANFGVDFNPAANALRITSDTGQNLRQPFAGGVGDAPPATATVVDGALNYAGALATGISGSAYINNDLDPNTGTALYAADTNRDQTSLQDPPNAGTLVARGPFGVDAGPDAGVDIYSTVRGGTTVAVQGWAVLDVGGKARSYTVDLTTGRVSDKGAFNASVTDLAIELNQL